MGKPSRIETHVAAGEMQLEEPWGRLLIAGGTDFATLGRKDKGGKSFVNEDRPELLSFNIVRPVANIKFRRIITSHSGCHQVAIDINSKAYLFGRNDAYQLTHPLPAAYTTPHTGTNGIPSPTPAATFPFPLTGLPDSNAPAALKAQGIVEAAVGRSHTILITEKGEAWSCGMNALGQCGLNSGEHVGSFMRIGGALLKEKVVAAAAGITFSVFLTDTGKVYAVGSGANGQLGNGKTGEHIAASKVFFTEQSDPLLVRGAIEGKKIVQITSGQQHTVALDDQGYCYSWGFGGLGRLGLGAQFDALVPTVVPTFAGPNQITRAASIAAGSTNTLFVDNQGMVYLCGKWKTSGDGSSGQPWMTPKVVQDISGFKMTSISAGGVTLFASTHDKKEGDFLVCWGQAATYGELGLGAGAPKSATKPTRVDSLDGIQILDIAAGQNTTFLIARPPPTQQATKAAVEAVTAAVEAAPASATPLQPASSGVDLSGFGFAFGPPKPKIPEVVEVKNTGLSRTEPAQWEELVRFPPVLDVADECQVCGREDLPEEPLECEMCEKAYHGGCLTPPLTGIPDGEWFCPSCSGERVPPPPGVVEPAGGKKRKAPPAETKPTTKGKKKKA